MEYKGNALTSAPDAAAVCAVVSREAGALEEAVFYSTAYKLRRDVSKEMTLAPILNVSDSYPAKALKAGHRLDCRCLKARGDEVVIEVALNQSLRRTFHCQIVKIFNNSLKRIIDGYLELCGDSNGNPHSTAEQIFE